MRDQIINALELGGTVVAKLWYTNDPVVYFKVVHGQLKFKELGDLEYRELEKEYTVRTLADSLVINAEHPDFELRVLNFVSNESTVLAEGSNIYKCRCGEHWESPTKDCLSFAVEVCPSCKQLVLPTHARLSKVPSSLKLATNERKAFQTFLDNARIGLSEVSLHEVFDKNRKKLVSKKNAVKVVQHLIEKELIEPNERSSYRLTTQGREYL